MFASRNTTSGSRLKSARRDRARGRVPRRLTRRGVVGVLAMMFLVMFSSLALAMAVVTQGNLRTSAAHMRVTRAMSSVDTGMGIAASRLREAASRFVVSKGEITPAYARQLWLGTYSSDPAVSVLPPSDGRSETGTPTSIATALAYHHDADDPANVVNATGTNAAAPIPVPAAPAGWVVTRPIGIDKNSAGVIVTAVQISYVAPDADGRVLAVVTGYDWDYTRGRWVTRTAQQYFSIGKTMNHAIIAPSRIMIGRNVQVNGPLAARYNSASLDSLDGPPLVVRSDFYGLESQLDRKLDDFYAAVLQYDVDGDNRLRIGHAVESQGLASLNNNDYTGDGAPDGAFVDMTRDRIVDDYDIFLRHFDADNDGRVVLSSALTLGTAAAGLTPEFELDDALALLIDSGKPDRNRNGRFNGAYVNGQWIWSTFRDNNGDGVRDADDVDANDVVLGYRDGVLDYKDQYAKIRGSIYFRASRSAWENSRDAFNEQIGDYQRFVQGAIRTEPGQIPVTFQASDAEAPGITDASFEAAGEALRDITAGGVSFAQQVAEQRGEGWTPARLVESTPYGSPSPSDWYSRPVYQNMHFKNVTIPMGNNGLFINCTFAGVTRVECYTENTHPSWQFYGEQERDALTGALVEKYPPPPAESPAALDQSYADPSAPGYGALPPPLIVPIDLNGDGVANDACTDTKRISNNVRFDGCLFVGSVLSDKPRVFTQVRNKLQFTGATQFTDRHPAYPNDPRFNPDSEDREEIAKSSMMLPNYSVDIGSYNSPQAQDVHLRGAIIAGVLDVRGNARIDGVLMMTFEPRYGEAPMSLYGQPAGHPSNFNITLGYFGPEDGDGEGFDLNQLSDLDGDGVPDIGWDSARDANGNLVPVSGWDGTHSDAWYDGVPDTFADISPGDYVRRAIPFNGFGRIELNWDPNIVLPDGLASPITIAPIRGTYEEGRFVIDG